MKRVSSLIVLTSAVALLAAAPAFAAKPSIQKGKTVCTAEVQKLTPAPKAVRIDDTQTRLTADAYIFTMKTKNADDSAGTELCTFNLDTSAAAVAPAK